MTLDEAIQHCEEVARENEKQYSNCPMKYDGAYANNGKSACKCAEEHRQLAEWLKDYKRLLEQAPKIGHWIDRFPAKECKCSVCDFLICISNGSYIDMVGQMKYCPNCGAKMESEGEE